MYFGPACVGNVYVYIYICATIVTVSANSSKHHAVQKEQVRQRNVGYIAVDLMVMLVMRFCSIRVVNALILMRVVNFYSVRAMRV